MNPEDLLEIIEHAGNATFNTRFEVSDFGVRIFAEDGNVLNSNPRSWEELNASQIPVVAQVKQWLRTCIPRAAKHNS